MPPEHDADAIARGDILPDDGSAATPPTDAPETPSAAPSSDAPEEGEVVSAEAAEPEAKEPEPTPEPEAKADDDPRIPKARFDEAVGKERNRAETAEAELQKYRAREQQQKNAENYEESMAKQKELLKQHSSLLADGDLDKAADVMEEVLQLRDDMQNARMEQRAANATNAAKIEVQYDATVTRLEAEYPEINPDSEEFDQAVIANVQAMVTGIMQNEGKSPADALQKATDILLKPLKEAKSQSLREQPSQDAVDQGMRRTQQQIDKNVDANNKQPPQTAEVGSDSDKVGGPLTPDALKNMSFEEFVNVPDSELAKIRGDYIQ